MGVDVDAQSVPTKRRPGRPKGSKNKTKIPLGVARAIARGEKVDQLYLDIIEAEVKTNKALALPPPAGVPQVRGQQRRLSDALRDVLNLSPQEAARRLSAQEAPTMADLIALSVAAEAKGGNIKAVEQIGDRTEGRPIAQAPQVADGMVDRLVRLLVVGAKADIQEKRKEKQIEEAKKAAITVPVISDTNPDDDLPLGSWTK